MLVDVAHWNDFMGVWLNVRAELTKTWQVRKHAELHAVDLVKGRGAPCEDEESNGKFGKPARLGAYRVALNQLSQFQPLTVTTVGANLRQQAEVYGHFIDHLDRWASKNNTHVMVVYDGKSGDAEEGADAEARSAAQEDAWRDLRPYRLVHRALDLSTRRIIEDVIGHDSKSSQLIQAADLVAYGAYQWKAHISPEIWPKVTPVPKVWQAYEKLEERWMPDAEHGITWIK